MNNRNRWRERVRALMAVGMTHREIGEAVGLSTGAVGDLAIGRIEQPRGDAALALDKLHRRKCGALPPLPPPEPTQVAEAAPESSTDAGAE